MMLTEPTAPLSISVIDPRYLPFPCFFGGFTLSTSAITSLNGSGMWGIGFEFVIRFGSPI
jgi:hypothetical protein